MATQAAATFNLLTPPGSRARAGELVTPHGTVKTPVLLPVGTQATVKTLTPEEVRHSGFDMLLCNTYHLHLRPGTQVVEAQGGLHRFMGWDGAILTDSGGYQVFSLAQLRKLDDDGVTFRSHIDGSSRRLTPELVIEYQEALGADVIMVLDECAAADADEETILRAMRRTHRWAERCQQAQTRQDQALYAIVQGGVYPELRRESAEFLVSLDFPGYAIGGLSIGEPKQVTYDITETVTAVLPTDKPRYLMGVGAPEDIVEGVARGIDIFDSALPTRVARNGSLYTMQGRLNVLNAAYATGRGPIDAECDCYTCRHFTTAYINHLFKARELLAYRLATLHNLFFISRLVRLIRESVLDGSFEAFREKFLANYRTTNEAIRLEQKRRWLQAKRDKE